MAGVGGAVGGLVGNAVNGALDSTGSPQPQQPVPDDMTAFQAKLQKLQMMKDANMLSDQEFAQLKQQLLTSIL